MKKALSLALALLVAFSMFSVVAAAAGETVKVTFIISEDPFVAEVVEVQPGTVMTPYTPANPERADTETTRYTFKGWRSSLNGNLYFESSIPTPDGSVSEIVYTAEFSEKDISGNQSFWNFVESIFERINLIFEYFAAIFNW